MKIAVIAHAYHTIKQPFSGGLEAHTHQLVTELHRQGHTVTLFAQAGSESAAKLIAVNRCIPVGGDNNPNYAHAYRRVMHKIAAGKYDLIINNGLHYMPILMHNSTMPPMLTVFHTPPYPKVTDLLRMQPPLPNRTYVAVSAFTARQWQPYTSSTIHIVANGLNPKLWRPNLTNPQIRTAVWAGRITPEKGTHVAIKACLLANIPLKLVGPVSDQDYFDRIVKPLLRHDLISFVAHIDQAGVNQLLANASVALVTPLWDEPFGLVAIEAWASGTPVAALPNGALPSLVMQSVGSLANSESADDLAVALKKALKVSRKACRRYVEVNFSLEEMTAAYLALVPDVTDEQTTTLAWQLA